MIAATSWPDAVVAVAGILLVASIVIVIVWQIFATGRASMSVQREKAYRELAEESTAAQRRVAEELGRANAELAEQRRQTSELQRVLAEVE